MTCSQSDNRGISRTPHITTEEDGTCFSSLAGRIVRHSIAIVLTFCSLENSACVAGVVRLVYVIRLYTTEDPSWNTAFVSISSTIEICCAIIAASIPPTKVFVDRCFPNLISSTRQGTSYWQQRQLGSIELGSNRDRRRRNPTDNMTDGSRLRSESKREPSILVTQDFEMKTSPSPAGSIENYHHEPPPYRTRDLSQGYL